MAEHPLSMQRMLERLSFVSDISTARVQHTFGEEKFGRLQAVKGRYDPENVFRLNQNVPPPER